MRPASFHSIAILVTAVLLPRLTISQEEGRKRNSLFGAGDVGRIVRLLDQRHYRKALALADKSWGEARKEMLRRLPKSEGRPRLAVPAGNVESAVHAPNLGSDKGIGWGIPTRGLSCVGIDPKVFVVGSGTRADCQRIVDKIHSLDDPEAVPHLLSLSDKELSGHAIGAVFAMGWRLRKTDGEQGGELACKALVAWEERKPIHAEMKRSECLHGDSSGLRLHCLDQLLAGASPRALLDVYRRYVGGQQGMQRDRRRSIRDAVVAAAAMSESKRDFPRAARRRPPGPKNPMVLLAALSDEYVGIRIYAAARLGGNDAKLRWSDVPTTVRHLTKALGDTDSRVAIQAAASLAGYRSVAGMRFLMEPANSPLLRSQDDGTRRCVGALVMAMGEFGLREGTPWIIAQCEKHPELVPLAVETMWAMRDAASIDFLGEVLVDKEMKGRVRDRALFSLSRTMDNRAFPYIRKVLEEAEKGGEWRMVSSCLVAMSMIHPDLSFDHLARWARPHSAGKAKRGDEESGGVSRTAFLVLHHKSGYPDVVRQLGSAPGLMRKGMERFWTEKKEILDAWDEMRHARYTSPSPTRERLAWRKLANTVNSASKTTRKIVLQCGEFYWDEKTSRDGTLKIRKVVKDGGLSLTVTER